MILHRISTVVTSSMRVQCIVDIVYQFPTLMAKTEAPFYHGFKRVLNNNVLNMELTNKLLQEIHNASKHMPKLI